MEIKTELQPILPLAFLIHKPTVYDTTESFLSKVAFCFTVEVMLFFTYIKSKVIQTVR